MKKLGHELTLMLLLTDGTDYRVEDLCKLMDCTRRNLYYYIKFLRDYGFNVIKTKGFYRLDPNSPFFTKIFDSINFTTQEAQMLYNVAKRGAGKSPIYASIKRKIENSYDLRLHADIRYKKKQTKNLEKIIKAINNRKVVCLHNYSSPHSHTISDRIVEPFLLLNDNQDVRCFEISSQKCKTFKIARIEDLEVYNTQWLYTDQHKQLFTDVFNFTGDEHHQVHLILGQLSANLLLEEFPQASIYLKQIADYQWEFKAEVASIIGVGRFILGLFDDIEIIESDELKSFIYTKINQMKERIDHLQP